MKRLLTLVFAGVFLLGCTNQGTIFSNEYAKNFENSLEALEGKWVADNNDVEAVFKSAPDEDKLISLILDDRKIKIEDFKILDALDFLIEYTNNKGAESFFHGKFYSFKRERIVLKSPEEDRIILIKQSED